EALLDDGRVWIVAGVEPGAPLAPSLAVRLASVVIEVPALCTRAADLPALAEAILGRLCERTGRRIPSLSPAALEALARHTWPGDLAEMESVLGAALLGAGERIEPDHLAMAPLAVPTTANPAPAPAAQPDGGLEFMLAELAHELRNPMVTIKTFARHLPSL